MTEQLRRDYLQALGIESYVARWVLPGAAASAVCELEADAEEQVEAAPSPSSSPSASSAVDVEQVAAAVVAGDTTRVDPGKAKSPRAESLLGETKKTRASQRPVTTATAAATPVHRFMLSAWRIADDVMVLDSRQLSSALPVWHLLLNMSRALGFKPTGLPRAELLRWPLVEHSTDDIAQSIENARGMVRAYVAAQHEKQPIATVLLMGGEAARHGLPAADFDIAINADSGKASIAPLLGKTFLLPRDEVSSRNNVDEGDASPSPGAENTPEKSPPLQALVLPSLTAMLRKPSLKALVWKAIKPLRVSP